MQGDSERTRRDILNAAVKVFSARGFSGSTLREISLAAGLTAGSLHHHFPTKHALYGAAFEYAASELYTGFMELVNLHDDLHARLHALLFALVDPGYANRYQLSMILRGWIDQSATPVPLNMPPIVEQTLSIMANDALAKDEIRQEDVPLLTATFRAMAWGIVVLNLNQQDQAAAAVEGFMRTLSGALTRPAREQPDAKKAPLAQRVSRPEP